MAMTLYASEQRLPETHTYYCLKLPDRSAHSLQPVQAENGSVHGRCRYPVQYHSGTTRAPRRFQLRSLGGRGVLVCPCARSTTEWHEHRV